MIEDRIEMMETLRAADFKQYLEDVQRGDPHETYRNFMRAREDEEYIELKEARRKNRRLFRALKAKGIKL